jgi:hypothetical protein
MDILKLKSGRELHVNRGFVSINEDLEISEGYDSGLLAAPNEKYYEYDEDRLTKDEALELADILIDRWNRFKIACQKD